MATREQHIFDVMTQNPFCLARSSTVMECATCMRDRDIGEVIVCNDDGTLCGVVTDRDLVVRCLAEGLDPMETLLADVCTVHPETIAAEADLHSAVNVMRQSAVRRLPVCDSDGMPIGVVSIGDLAMTMDERSALADISRAAPNN